MAEEYIRVSEGFIEVRQRLTAPVLSKTGKTMIVFTTSGFVGVEGGVADGVKANITVNVPRGYRQDKSVDGS